jgi:hypothetical protein
MNIATKLNASVPSRQALGARLASSEASRGTSVDWTEIVAKLNAEARI